MDILKIMNSLDMQNVYRLRLGRTFHDEDEPVQDAESIGLHKLIDGRPSVLADYNESFKATQEAYRRPIVSEMVSHTSLPRYPDHVEPPASPERRHTDTIDETEELGIRAIELASDEDEDEELGGLGDESDEEPDDGVFAEEVELENNDLDDIFRNGLFNALDDNGEWPKQSVNEALSELVMFHQ
jgi:hypothetical protein